MSNKKILINLPLTCPSRWTRNQTLEFTQQYPRERVHTSFQADTTAGSEVGWLKSMSSTQCHPSYWSTTMRSIYCEPKYAVRKLKLRVGLGKRELGESATTMGYERILMKRRNRRRSLSADSRGDDASHPCSLTIINNRACNMLNSTYFLFLYFTIKQYFF